METVLDEQCYCGADARSNLAAAKVLLGFLACLLAAFPKSVRSAKDLEFLPGRKLGKSFSYALKGKNFQRFVYSYMK